MEKIEYKNISVNGINMHVTKIGEGPAVIFVHGFPELWYSWRHQMLYLSNKGYRAIAPNLHGYGDTDCLSEIDSYTTFHIIGDLVALLDVLELEQLSDAASGPISPMDVRRSRDDSDPNDIL
ncbi:AB hydrolase superfamily protein YfhM-like [Capsicum annuum]|uniref:AB hydrolase superfamily protein YfhM-like n=1 Tax=Capsicum annuum TaxID=4072 RepID=UPI0007BF661F|nr:AB hydrolase superfamily protein YfhM-like [Capsicum annuum]